MGEEGCVMMHAFSYTCTPSSSSSSSSSSSLQTLPLKQQQQQQLQMQGNSFSINAALLGDSVSLGRFAASLSLDKCSSFSSLTHNNNRYVEEAERFSQPGSVAQKKAFFEAHYKRIADAKKAALLLEQQQQQQLAASSTQIPTTPTIESQSHTSHSYTTAAQQQHHAHESLGVNEADTPLEIVVMEDEMLIENMTPGGGLGEVTTGTPKLDKPHLSARVHPKKETSNSTKTYDTSAASDNSATPQIEKPLLKNSASTREAPSVNSKKKSAFSSFKSSIYPKTSQIPSPTKKMMVPSRIIKEHKKTIPIANNKSTSQYMEKKETKKPFIATTTPATTPDRLVAAPSNAKTPNTRVGSAAYRAFQACMSPLRTPNTVTSARMSKNVSSTPQPDDTSRTNPPRDGSRTSTPKWKILSAACSKSLAANRNKLQSPTISTPFTLRTEERAARRKQKLEEKFNLKETPKEQVQTNIKTPKVQLQTKMKEKAENELRKLRRSFCFNARPPPNLSKQRRETTENHNIKKGTTIQGQGQSISQQPSCRPSVLNKSHNRSIYRSSPATASHFLSSSAAATNHENTSPNIQYYY